ncbi:MAG: hypothetical protein RL071_376 [Pseudomonadota bacterium]
MGGQVRAAGRCRAAVTLLAGLGLAGCVPTEGDGKSGDQVSVDGSLRTIRTSEASQNDGIAVVAVDVNEGETSMLLTAQADQLVSVEYIEDPAGERVFYWEDWYGDYSLTGAIFPEARDMAVNWPVRAADAPLRAGIWYVGIATTNNNGYYVNNVDIDLTLQLKSDDDTSDATVRALVAYADGLSDDDEVVAGTEAAVERWAEVWAAAGITLEVRYTATDLDPVLPTMYDGGSAEIRSLAADEGDDNDVTVVIGDTVGNQRNTYGISGGIPGTLVATKRAAVVISWVANAGGDGTFEPADVQLYGETLAHEVGHYMGLFHPVESSYDYWDALDDTPECTNARGCENNLGDNNMFPYPVCDFRSCLAQDVITDEQAGVSHRYAGAL